MLLRIKVMTDDNWRYEIGREAIEKREKRLSGIGGHSDDNQRSGPLIVAVWRWVPSGHSPPPIRTCLDKV